MLENYLVETCYIVTVVVDKFGSYLRSSATAESCRFRDVSTLAREAHAEINDADAMIWLSPNTSVGKNSIIEFDGAHYQVERLTKAKRLGQSQVQFVKCDLKVIDISIS